jgi:DUF971 family protein
MELPSRYEIIGNSLAIQWSDGKEDFWDGPFLRKHSPSADQAGEMDIFGRIRGGASKDENFEDIFIKDFHLIGNYALRLVFSDGHATGIYSWEYLQSLQSEK